MPAQNRVWSDQALAAQRSGQPLDEGDEDRPLPSSGTVVGSVRHRMATSCRSTRSSTSLVADVRPISRTARVRAKIK